VCGTGVKLDYPIYPLPLQERVSRPATLSLARRAGASGKYKGLISNDTLQLVAGRFIGEEVTI